MAQIAKHHFDTVFIILEAHRRFRKQVRKHKVTEFWGTFLRDAFGEGFGALWVDFGIIFGGLGAPISEKRRSKKDVKKGRKKSCGGVQGDPEISRNGGGVP